MTSWKSILFVLGAVATLGTAAPAAAQSYEVTITNLTRGQTFTPILVATHKPRVRIFTAGQPASAELAALAEGGDTAPLLAVLDGNADVGDATDSGGGLLPGQSVMVSVSAGGGANHLSLAAMLIPTNDAFMGATDVAMPTGSAPTVLDVIAYDAGSEPNDELCANIPGPSGVCGGTGGSPNAGGEGRIHVHAGIHGIGDLMAKDRDWRNPVARVTIRKVSN